MSILFIYDLVNKKPSFEVAHAKISAMNYQKDGIYYVIRSFIRIVDRRVFEGLGICLDGKFEPELTDLSKLLSEENVMRRPGDFKKIGNNKFLFAQRIEPIFKAEYIIPECTYSLEVVGQATFVKVFFSCEDENDITYAFIFKIFKENREFNKWPLYFGATLNISLPINYRSPTDYLSYSDAFYHYLKIHEIEEKYVDFNRWEFFYVLKGHFYCIKEWPNTKHGWDLKKIRDKNIDDAIRKPIEYYYDMPINKKYTVGIWESTGENSLAALNLNSIFKIPTIERILFWSVALIGIALAIVGIIIGF
ncbi:MAG TPA: hypothetical protein VMW09_03430 [Desulfatiglandales bacterium]|nr:hypothetical protein [Desulfatiglandales bacterium]